MTVAELIEELKKMPHDLPVGTYDQGDWYPVEDGYVCAQPEDKPERVSVG